jgi:hypothetical protein
MAGEQHANLRRLELPPSLPGGEIQVGAESSVREIPLWSLHAGEIRRFSRRTLQIDSRLDGLRRGRVDVPPNAGLEGCGGGVRDIEVTILALVFIVAHVVVYIIH